MYVLITHSKVYYDPLGFWFSVNRTLWYNYVVWYNNDDNDDDKNNKNDNDDDNDEEDQDNDDGDDDCDDKRKAVSSLNIS